MKKLALWHSACLVACTLFAKTADASSIMPKGINPLAGVTKIENKDKNLLDSINLNEVVVTGQGNAIRRRRLSSSVTKVSASELQKTPATRIDQMLQNALPNVQLSLTNGQPGTTSIIKSRGLSSAFANSTPIIYIDGVRIDNLNTGSILNYSKHGYGANPYTIGDMPMGEMASSSTLSDISIENIDHIEYVPGGAATTLYGSDAANGVIQIFTKKGSEAGFRASVTAEMGCDVPTTQFYHFRRTRELLNQTGFQQRYRLSLSGGNQTFGYSLGASMGGNTGIIIHNNNEQKKVRHTLWFACAITPHFGISKLVWLCSRGL